MRAATLVALVALVAAAAAASASANPCSCSTLPTPICGSLCTCHIVNGTNEASFNTTSSCTVNGGAFYFVIAAHDVGALTSTATIVNASGSYPLFNGEVPMGAAYPVSPLAAIVESTSTIVSFNATSNSSLPEGLISFVATTISCTPTSVTHNGSVVSWTNNPMLTYTVSNNGQPADGSFLTNSSFALTPKCEVASISVNSHFQGPESILNCPIASAVINISLATTPSAPASITLQSIAALAGNSSSGNGLSLSWAKPADGGCAALTYCVTITSQQTAPTGNTTTNTTCYAPGEYTDNAGTITPNTPAEFPATNGSYAVTVQAKNVIGSSPLSSATSFCSFAASYSNPSYQSISIVNNTLTITGLSFTTNAGVCASALLYNFAVTGATTITLSPNNVAVTGNNAVVNVPLQFNISTANPATLDISSPALTAPGTPAQWQFCPHTPSLLPGVTLGEATAFNGTITLSTATTWSIATTETCSGFDFIVSLSYPGSAVVTHTLKPSDYTVDAGKVTLTAAPVFAIAANANAYYTFSVAGQTVAGQSTPLSAEFSLPCTQPLAAPSSVVFTGLTSADTSFAVNATFTNNVPCVQISFQLFAYPLGSNGTSVLVPVPSTNVKIVNSTVTITNLVIASTANDQYNLNFAVGNASHYMASANSTVCAHIPEQPQYLNGTLTQVASNNISLTVEFVPAASETCPGLNYAVTLTEEKVPVYSYTLSAGQYKYGTQIAGVLQNAEYYLWVAGSGLAGVGPAAKYALSIPCQLPPSPVPSSSIIAVVPAATSFQINATWVSFNCRNSSYTLTFNQPSTNGTVVKTVTKDDVTPSPSQNLTTLDKLLTVELPTAAADVSFVVNLAGLPSGTATLFCPHVPAVPTNLALPAGFVFNTSTISLTGLTWNSAEACQTVTYTVTVTYNGTQSTSVTISPGQYTANNNVVIITSATTLTTTNDINGVYTLSVAAHTIIGASAPVTLPVFAYCPLAPGAFNLVDGSLVLSNTGDALTLSGAQWGQAAACRNINYKFTVDAAMFATAADSSFVVGPADVSVTNGVVSLSTPKTLTGAFSPQLSLSVVAEINNATSPQTTPTDVCSIKQAQPAGLQVAATLGASNNLTVVAQWNFPNGTTCYSTTTFTAVVTSPGLPNFTINSFADPESGKVNAVYLKDNFTSPANAVYTLTVTAITAAGASDPATATFSFSPKNDDSSSGLSNTVIAGIAVGATVGVVAIALIIYKVASNKRRDGYKDMDSDA